MIDGTSSFVNGFNFGAGGIDKFVQLTDEIQQNIEEQQEELEKEKTKSLGDLSPVEVLCLCIDSSLNNAQKIQENRKNDFFRDEQFRRYVKDAYGVII
jgi:hypothetical protein